MALELSQYSLLNDGTTDGFDASRYSLLDGKEADPATGGTVDPSHFSLYPNLNESNALDADLGDKNAWLRKLARSVAERDVNPDPQQSQPQSEQPTRSASTTPVKPPSNQSSAFMTQNPEAVGKSERKAHNAEAVDSIAHSAGEIVKMIASAAAGGAAAGGGGGAAAGGATDAATGASYSASSGIGEGAAPEAASAGGTGSTFGGDFMSAFKGGNQSGMGGYLGNYARQKTGGIYGQGGEGGFNMSGIMGKLGGGGGGGGGGAAADDVAVGGSGGKASESVMSFLRANKLRKQEGLLAEAQGGGLTTDSLGEYFAS